MTPEQQQATNSALADYANKLDAERRHWKEKCEVTSDSLHMLKGEMENKLADAQAEIGLWASAAESLWDLMDDIDTLSDSIKPRDEASYSKFYRLTMELVKRRNDNLRHNETGGLSLVLPPSLAPEEEKAMDDLLACSAKVPLKPFPYA